eukprot:3850701-Prymnesium_polylepis.3
MLGVRDASATGRWKPGSGGVPSVAVSLVQVVGPASAGTNGSTRAYGYATVRLDARARFDRSPGLALGRQVLVSAGSMCADLGFVFVGLRTAPLHDQDVRQRRWRQERKAQHRSSPVEWQYASCCLRWQPEA